MRVAESIVIRLPIFQVGWFSACSTVIDANSDAGVLRNGPPEAVSQAESFHRYDALDLFHPPAPHALMHGIVLAVDRQQRNSAFLRFGGDQLTGRNQTFFVSEPESLSRPHRFVCGLETRYANDRTYHEIDVTMRCDPNRSR